MPFDIRVHEAEKLIEVIYPEQPTRADVADYALRMTTVIEQREGEWRCLVDQRALQLLDPALVSRITTLNSFARTNGMTKSARIVRSPISALQAREIAGEIRTFTTREEAIAWLEG